VNPEFLSRDEVQGPAAAGVQAHQLRIRTPIPRCKRRQLDCCRSISCAGRWPGCGRRASRVAEMWNLISACHSTPKRSHHDRHSEGLQPDRVSLFSFAYLPGSAIGSARSPPMI